MPCHQCGNPGGHELPVESSTGVAVEVYTVVPVLLLLLLMAVQCSVTAVRWYKTLEVIYMYCQHKLYCSIIQNYYICQGYKTETKH